MGKIIERIVDAQRMEDIISVFGSFDENIKRIEDEFHVSIVNRGTELKVSGDEEAADQAVRTLEGLLTLSSKGEQIDEQQVRYLMNLVREGNDAQVAKMTKGGHLHHRQGQACEGQDRGPAGLCGGHPEEHRYHRRGACGYRQDLSGGGCRRGGLPGADREPHHSDPSAVEAGGAGLPAGDLQNKVDPYPAPCTTPSLI